MSEAACRCIHRSPDRRHLHDRRDHGNLHPHPSRRRRKKCIHLFRLYRNRQRLKKEGLSHQKQLMPYGRDSCFAWNRCHIFLNKRGTYGIIADDLRFATQLSNVYGNAIRAKLANAQTTRSVADPFSSFVTQNLQSICSLCHRNPRFFIKIGDPIPLQIHESCHSPRPMPKAVFVSADCGTAKEKSRTFLQRTALRV